MKSKSAGTGVPLRNVRVEIVVPLSAGFPGKKHVSAVSAMHPSVDSKERLRRSVKKYPVLRPGSPFFTGKSGFGVVGIGFGMARGGGKIG